MHQYRNVSKAGMGHWFGAHLDGMLVGDLGLFYENKIGRYQNVGTHPNHRRQGVCRTLVHFAGQFALQEFGVSHLVMEADPDYHAARIYESLEFQRREISLSLTWWQGKMNPVKGPAQGSLFMAKGVD